MSSTKSLGISRQRGQLPASSSGLGLHFTSPMKGRRAPKRKTQKNASSALDFHAKKRRLEAELAALMDPTAEVDELTGQDPFESASGTSGYDLDATEVHNTGATAYVDLPLDEVGLDSLDSSIHLPPLDNLPTEPKPKRLTPDQAALHLSENWQSLLPSLIYDLLAYYAASAGQEIRSVGQELSETCPSLSCRERKSTRILVLYFDRMWPHPSSFSLVVFLTISRFHLNHRNPLPLPYDPAGPLESGIISNSAISGADGRLSRFFGLLLRVI